MSRQSRCIIIFSPASSSVRREHCTATACARVVCFRATKNTNQATRSKRNDFTGRGTAVSIHRIPRTYVHGNNAFRRKRNSNRTGCIRSDSPRHVRYFRRCARLVDAIEKLLFFFKKQSKNKKQKSYTV